jgi:hypothetical protein
MAHLVAGAVAVVVDVVVAEGSERGTAAGAGRGGEAAGAGRGGEAAAPELAAEQLRD